MAARTLAVALLCSSLAPAYAGRIHVAKPQPAQPPALAAAPIDTASSQPHCYNGNNTVTCTVKLQYFGGRVIPNARVYAVYWNGNVAAATTDATSGIGAFFQAITNSDWMDWYAEYRTDITIQAGSQKGKVSATPQFLGRGNFAGAVTLTPATCATADATHACTLSGADVENELDAQITAGVLQPPDENTIYMVYFPAGLTISDPGSTSCVQYCAYHSTFDSAQGHGRVYYGVMPDLGSGGCQNGCGTGSVFQNLCSASSHELGEAMTDAEVGIGTTVDFPLAWYDNESNSQGETGDMCNQSTALVTNENGEGPFIVQQMFSVKDWVDATSNSCVSKRFEPNDFKLYLAANAGSLAAGSNVVVPITTAVTAGTAGAVGTLSLAVSGLPKGVTASFPATIAAGASFNLTLTAAANAVAAQDAQVVVRGSTSGGLVHTAALLLQVTTGPVTNDWSIAIPAATTALAQGRSSAPIAITTAKTSGTAEDITFAAAGLPAGVTAAFSPAHALAGAAASVTLSAAGNAAPVSATAFTIGGTSASQSHSSGAAQVQVDGLPTARVTAPASGATVSGLVNVTATASAGTNASLSSVDILLDGVAQPSTATSATSRSFAWDTRTAVNGSHTLRAVATDSDSGSQQSSAVTVTAANDFSVALPSGTIKLAQGRTIQIAVGTAVTSGSAVDVTFAISGLPAGVTGSFSPTHALAGSISYLGLSASASAAPSAPVTLTMTGTSASVPAGHTSTGLLQIDGLPTAQITSPTASSVSGIVTFSATATAGTNGSLASLALDIDGSVKTTSGSPASFTWDTRTAQNGSHTLHAVATDADGGSFTAALTITVSNTNPNDFSVALVQPARTLVVGGSGTFTVHTASTSGVAETITFGAISGLPAGASGAFNPPSVTAGGDATLTITAGATPAAATTFTITGTSPSVGPGHSASAQVQIDGLPSASFANPADGATVSGLVNIACDATAGANAALSSLTLKIDGTTKASGVASAGYAWDTSSLANNSTHTLTAVAIDADGGQATATATVTVIIPVANDFTLAVTPAKGTATIGGAAAVYTVTTAIAAGSAESISLSATGLPPGVAATFSSPTVTAGGTATLSLAAPAGTPSAARTTFTITGTSAAQSSGHAATASVAVIAQPTVALTAPADGATVNGTVALAASAAVDPGTTLANVVFKDGTQPLGASTSAQATATWDTTTAANGPHQLTAVVTDGAGNSVASAVVTVTVANGVAPEFSLQLPQTGVVLTPGGEAVSLTVSTGAVGAPASILLSVGSLPANVTASFTPNPVLAGQPSTLTLTAGPTAQSGSGTLTVTGTSHGISRTATTGLSVTGQSGVGVTLTAPLDGAQLSGTVLITASATVRPGTTLARIDFLVDDVKLGTATGSPGSLSWDTSTATAGAHVVQARAFDSTGASGAATVTVQVQRSSSAGGGCSSTGGNGWAAPALLLALGLLRRRRR